MKEVDQATVNKQLAILGNGIKNYIEENGLSRREVAKAAGISDRTLSSVIAGKTGNIASYLGVLNACGINIIRLVSQHNEFRNDSTLETHEVNKEVVNDLREESNITDTQLGMRMGVEPEAISTFVSS